MSNEIDNKSLDSDDSKKLDININVNPIPESVDKATGNLLCPISKEVGEIIGNLLGILTFKTKRMNEVSEFKNEVLKEEQKEKLIKKLSKIPKNKITNNVDKKTYMRIAIGYHDSSDDPGIREMFENLLVSSHDSDKSSFVHPIFVDIVNNMRSIDARLFKCISTGDFYKDPVIFTETVPQIAFSLNILKQMKLITTDGKLEQAFDILGGKDKYYGKDSDYKNASQVIINSNPKSICKFDFFPKCTSVSTAFIEEIQLTSEGEYLKELCIDDN